MNTGEITLKLEEAQITCNRNILIENSDYFKAMFEGPFIESNQSTITLEGVDFRAMNIILNILSTKKYIIEQEDCLIVLQVACMLQFVRIREFVITKLLEILQPHNCLKIWLVTEQFDIRPLFLKAKCMSLQEFNAIKDSECILELNLDEFCRYIGHRNLKTDNEFSVFSTAMNWLNENFLQFDNFELVLLRLISCVNWNEMEEKDLKFVMNHPQIRKNTGIVEMFQYYIDGRNEYSAIIKRRGNDLRKSLRRTDLSYPCILLDGLEDGNRASAPKKRKSSDEGEHSSFAYDFKNRTFQKLFDLDSERLFHSFDGYRIISYKHYVFVYGGERTIGHGDWNYSFWIYDTFKERWLTRDLIPHPRRHFQTCLVDGTIFIVGGMGVFRVALDTMIYYNYDKDKWSKAICLPCKSGQTKCCEFQKKMFLLDLNNQVGYFFDLVKHQWQTVTIVNDDIFRRQIMHTIFSYRGNLFIKGTDLIELKLTDSELVIVKTRELKRLPFGEMMESVLCDNLVYTLTKSFEGSSLYTLEEYNLDTDELKYVFKDAPKHSQIYINNTMYTVNSLKMFAFQHYNLVENDKFVNDIIL